MLYIREDIPSKLLSNNDQDSEIENIFVEINLRSKKWLICARITPKQAILKIIFKYFHKDLINIFRKETLMLKCQTIIFINFVQSSV